MQTYKFSTFQQLIDRVPHERIEDCLTELGKAFAAGKALAVLHYEVARSLAEVDGVVIPELGDKRVIELPDELEWIDDGKGEIGATLMHENEEFLTIKMTPKPSAESAT